MAHIRKKPFQSVNQSTITSYFDRNTTGLQAGSRSDSHSTPPLRPELPKNIQSSLLNVGMRVRKSVPEGYKTHKTLGLEYNELENDCLVVKAPLASQQPLSTRSTIGAATDVVSSGPVPASSAPPVMYRSDSSRELLPFCGLHSVGGMSQTSLSSVPSLVSQSSMGSVYRPATQDSGLKRSYSEEMEAELDNEYALDEPDQTEYTGNDSGSGDRLYARPTARLKAGHSFGSMDVAIAGDFHDEDVDFLQ